MFYEGPIYRPPSESGSLLVQATIGCPHNRCTFCMVYKKGPHFRIRAVDDIKKDLDEALNTYGKDIKTIFFPAGNTIAMDTPDLAEICCYSYKLFPDLKRITVYGSSQYIYKKGLEELKILYESGLSRIHVGLETGDDIILKRIKKGCTSQIQIEAGNYVVASGIELSLYVILGIGGQGHTVSHANETARVINLITPHFVRLRTFVPKVNTPLLDDVIKKKFIMLSPHGVIKETLSLVEQINIPTRICSDHYTNYVSIDGDIPLKKSSMINLLKNTLKRDEGSFRDFFVGVE